MLAQLRQYHSGVENVCIGNSNISVLQFFVGLVVYVKVTGWRMYGWRTLLPEEKVVV